MLADVPQRRRAQHSVHDGVQQYVSIRVAEQSLLVGYFDAAQNQLAVLHKAVNIISVTNAHGFLLL